MMQRVGDVCESCREFWEQQKKEPKTLKKLNTTMNKKIQVPACEHCDGDIIFRVHQLKNND